MIAEETRQIYPCAVSPRDKLTVVGDHSDDHLRITASAADSFYLSRNQVRGLMHQLTDWLADI